MTCAESDSKTIFNLLYLISNLNPETVTTEKSTLETHCYLLSKRDKNIFPYSFNNRFNGPHSLEIEQDLHKMIHNNLISIKWANRDYNIQINAIGHKLLKQCERSTLFKAIDNHIREWGNFQAQKLLIVYISMYFWLHSAKKDKNVLVKEIHKEFTEYSEESILDTLGKIEGYLSVK